MFPRRTSYTPTDEFAFVGDPPLWIPDADEIHVSCTFMRDKQETERLASGWSAATGLPVKVGGPAYNSPVDGFIPGKYVKYGVTFTTRGCNRRCGFCLVPEREGRHREIAISPGWNINDNNLLQASKGHVTRVFDMIEKQGRNVTFSGGIDARLVGDFIAEQFKRVRISEIFLACDDLSQLSALKRATATLSFLSRRQLLCYVLIAYNGETIEQAADRLQKVWDAGCLPFAQLYQPADRYINYSLEWKALRRIWSRPAETKSRQAREARKDPDDEVAEASRLGLLVMKL